MPRFMDKQKVHTPGEGNRMSNIRRHDDTQRRVAETHKRSHNDGSSILHRETAAKTSTESGVIDTPSLSIPQAPSHVPRVASHPSAASPPLAITHAPATTRIVNSDAQGEDNERGAESAQRSTSQAASPTVSGPHGNAHDWAVVPSSIERSVVPFNASAARAVASVDADKLPLTTRRVCPTCLRPLGDDLVLAASPTSELEDESDVEDDIVDDDEDVNGAESIVQHGHVLSTPHHRRRRNNRPRRGSMLRTGPVSFLTPQYFVHLARTMPLAIEDGSRAAKKVNFTLSASPTTTTSAQAPVITTNVNIVGGADEDIAPASPLLLSTNVPPPPFGMQGYVSAPRNTMRESNVYGSSAYYTEPECGPSNSLDVNAEPGIVWGTEDEDANAAAEDDDDDADKTLELPTRSTNTLTTTATREAASSSPRGGYRNTTTTTEGQARNTDASSPTIVRDHEAYGFYHHFFLELRKLGSGTFGGVFMCEHVMAGVPLGRFAVKKIPVGDNTAYLQHVLREVSILQRVKRHPNVVEYNHSWVEEAQLADFGPPVRCLFVLMEYANEGSLDTYLERHGTALSTMAVWYFFLSAVAGTAHLHQKNILHRDLKPQNLLLTGHKGRPPRVLVSDFGTAAFLSENSYERTGGTGTLEYMAPELFVKVPHETQGNNNNNTQREAPSADKSNVEHYTYHPDKASDMWSLGMILYYLACNGRLPARREDGSVVLQVQEHSPCPRPPEILQLIAALLQRDPRKRPSCHDILYSTIAQSIIRGFHGARHFNSDFLSHLSAVPLTTPPAITHRPLPPNNVTSHNAAAMALMPHSPASVRAGTNMSGRGVNHDEEEDEEDGEEQNMVHLQSSRVQYLNSTLEMPQGTLPLVHSPIQVHSHTCDVAVQTDPVRFADD